MKMCTFVSKVYKITYPYSNLKHMRKTVGLQYLL